MNVQGKVRALATFVIYVRVAALKADHASLNCVTGGWDPTTGEISPDGDTQIDQAFANVELNLKDAGADGWSQVYSIKSYHVPLDEVALAAMVRNLKKYLPNHRPIWTVLGVAALGEKEMKVEIDVVATCK